MPDLAPDILEQILIGFDVKDLIQFKSVCKSWYSFISSSRFINSQLKRSYSNDRNNINEFRHRRIHCSSFGKNLVGSSNGLICISPFHAKVLVTNPLTLELKKLKNPNISPSSCICWGFGYDSLTQDYKVILGFMNGKNRTCFQVLTLKSNVWKVIGQVKYYSYISTNVGILCNGALHWFMNDRNNNQVILSFHLSQEEFKVIPQPHDVPYKFIIKDTRLGIIDECLCLFGSSENDIWVLKNYDTKQSWEMWPYYSEMNDDVVHHLTYIPPRFFFCHDNIHLSSSIKYISAPVFVKSLVSPHVNRRPKKKLSVRVGSKYDVISWSYLVSRNRVLKRKRPAKNGKMNAKGDRDPPVPAPSAKV